MEQLSQRPSEGTAPLPSGVPDSPFTTLLFPETPSPDAGDGRDAASDLNLDQIVEAIVRRQEQPEFLAGLFYGQHRDAEIVTYRQAVFRDLQAPDLLDRVKQFAERLRSVRNRLTQIEKVAGHHKQGWFLDAAGMYCDAVRDLADNLAAASIRSRGLSRFSAFLSAYVGGPEFTALAADVRRCKDALAGITYCVRVRGLRVDVSRYEAEADYSAEVEETFERFAQGDVKDYRISYRGWPVLGHVAVQILDLVGRLFDEEFKAVEEFCRRHARFFDATVRAFEREIPFYLSYLDYIAPLQEAGLDFCHPETTTTKVVFATETFDLALASKLVPAGTPVVRNDFRLEGSERIFVVSGPNQGGKTTFARTFGQLHHLASVGCPVPGRTARLFAFDRLFTHFEAEEDLAKAGGKLEDDLVRVRDILQSATADSIVVMNEIFTSTTLRDGRFLGEKVLAKAAQLDLLCVYVTFIDELASFGESVVSMVSTIVPEDPSERTFKVVRGPADGLAYALAIAEKHGVTCARLRDRVGQ